MSTPLTREQVFEMIKSGDFHDLLDVFDTLCAELEGFRGIFGDYDEPLRTLEQACSMWNSLRAENERLKAEMGYHEAKDVVADLAAQLTALQETQSAEAADLRARCEAAEREWDTASKYIARIMKLEECIRDDQTSHPLNVLSHTGVSFVEKAVKWYQQQLAAMTQERDEWKAGFALSEARCKALMEVKYSY